MCEDGNVVEAGANVVAGDSDRSMEPSLILVGAATIMTVGKESAVTSQRKRT